MATAAIIGEELRIEGYWLAGALVCPAESRYEAAAAWESLPTDTGVLIMTPSAADWLADRLRQRPELLTVVMRT